MKLNRKHNHATAEKQTVIFRSPKSWNSFIRYASAIGSCLPGWLVEWLPGWLADWLADWLAQCLAVGLLDTSPACFNVVNAGMLHNWMSQLVNSSVERALNEIKLLEDIKNSSLRAIIQFAMLTSVIGIKPISKHCRMTQWLLKDTAQDSINSYTTDLARHDVVWQFHVAMQATSQIRRYSTTGVGCSVKECLNGWSCRVNSRINGQTRRSIVHSRPNPGPPGRQRRKAVTAMVPLPPEKHV